ncbi:gas vesicle protein [Streptomyces sp. NPDC056161]|uniref:gas vesicle protein GvpO n=1 Tax=Streptomyces sp. NPDC056161 TaxID=3345732 RepID=UPI0035D87D05
MSNTNGTSKPHDPQRGSSARTAHRSTENYRASGRRRPPELLRQARTQFAELTGMDAETVSSFEQTEDGWSLEVEIRELARVPDTMSLMASYQVDLDTEGQLTGYRRIRRYERGRADPRGPGGGR